MSQEKTTDKDGVWVVDGIFRYLIEPSEEYLKEQKEIQQREEEEYRLERLKPTEEEVKIAEIKLVTTNTLIDLEVI